MELLQQQLAEMEAQLAHQSQLKLQELIDALSSGDANKQGLSQQLSKFLEQCQMQPPQSSVTIIHQDNPQEMHHHQEHIIKVEDTVGQDLAENSDNSLSDNLEAAAVHQLDDATTVTHLNEIPEGFHVLCTTSEGHVVVTRSIDSVISLSAGDRKSSSENTVGSSPNISTSTALSDTAQLMFGHVLTAQESEKLCTRTNDGSSDGLIQLDNDMKTDDHGNTVGGHHCHLEVVAAADGLASLGTDVTVIDGANDDQELGGTFVMDIDSGERIFVQTSEENISLQIDQSGEEEQYGTDEPKVKLLRLT